jgi:23S rRNA pseudouridine955/2504/2580 synthase
MTKEYKFIPITKDEVDSRLDRVIRKNYPYLNQAKIEMSLRNKSIIVNQQKVKSNYRLNLGDHLQIDSSLIQENYSSNKDKKQITEADIRLITDNIIYRDADLIAINKPAGLAVQGGSKIKVSVDDIMPHMLEQLEIWDKPVHKLVHRLDKETSGVLLIALNNHTAQDLAYAFKEHNLEKKYLAILTGKVVVNNGQISSYINKESDQVLEDNAFTNYKVIARKPNATLVEFKPITGKTHQLRLHSLELGFPILGDLKYDPSLEGLKNVNLHLHAAEITIPYQGSYLKLKADLPEYFQKSIKEIFGTVKL